MGSALALLILDESYHDEESHANSLADLDEFTLVGWMQHVC